jgi:hypothetical protein
MLVLEEYAGKDLVRLVPNRIGDLSDKKVRLLKKLAGFFHSETRQVGSRRHSNAGSSYFKHIKDSARGFHCPNKSCLWAIAVPLNK